MPEGYQNGAGANSHRPNEYAEGRLVYITVVPLVKGRVTVRWSDRSTHRIEPSKLMENGRGLIQLFHRFVH